MFQNPGEAEYFSTSGQSFRGVRMNFYYMLLYILQGYEYQFAKNHPHFFNSSRVSARSKFNHPKLVGAKNNSIRSR